ncbi:hypothetical protein Tco_1488701, partial [Tanacetum coccineum]
VATIASSLVAEQDSGNITKTRSKETPNEASFLGTTSGGGPRCQETIRDTIAQTRFENVYKLSNDSLLARGNTLQSDEDRLKLQELMELCINLQQRVLNLENTKTTQANEIATRVESSGDEESLGEDASKQGRVNAIDDDDDEITLVSVQDDVDAEMFDVGTLTGDEVFAKQEVAAKDVNLTINEVTLAQALTALKSVKPKVKGDVIEEPSVPVSAASASIKVSAATTTTATIPTPRKGIVITELGTPTITRSSQQPSHAKVQDKGKGKMIVPEPVKPKKKDAKIKADHELAQRLQAEEQEELSDAENATLFNMEGKKIKDLKNKSFDSNQKMFDRAFKRVNTFVDFRTDMVEGSSKGAGEELEQKSTKKHKVDEDKDTAELQSLIEVIPDEEEVAIDVVPLATKPPTIVDWKIYKEGKKSYYQIIRADRSSKMYKIFNQMLKSFDMQDLEDLYKLVKARYGSTRPVEDLDLLLLNDLKTMFEPHVKDTI